MKNKLTIFWILIAATTLPFLAWADGDVEAEQNRALFEKWRADPEHYARLRRDLQSFLALPSEKQEELRRLDRELHDEDSAVVARLHGVMERYADWLGRLVPADRERIEQATNTAERIELIRALRAQEWLESLPKATREELAKLPPAQRPARIAELRNKDHEHDAAWRITIRHWDELVRNRPDTTNIEQLKPALASFVTEYLWPMLNDTERARLKSVEGQWPLYPRTLVELVDQHPIRWPGPTTGPRHFEDLPLEIRRKLPQVKSAALPVSQEGKWPEYAAAVTLYAHNHAIRLPKQLGPAKLADFPPNVKAFCEQKLFPVLTDEERAKRDKAEGHWPGYPSVLAALARRHQMQIPGTALPGPPAFWDKFRSRPVHRDELPEVPDKVLMDFVRSGMTPDERGMLPSQALSDPQSRAKIKQLYFQRNEAELKRLRQNDLRKELKRESAAE